MMTLRSPRCRPISSDGVLHSCIPLKAAHPTAMRGRTIGWRWWTKAFLRAATRGETKEVMQVVWLYEHAIDFDADSGVFTAISVTGCWHGASSVRQLRRASIGR